MGSGKLLKKAIEKYGLENFTKEILFDFNNEAEMNSKEAELVVVSEETYNLCPGGHGGFGYINQNGLNNIDKNWSLIKEKLRKHNSGKKNTQLSVWNHNRHKQGLVNYNTKGMLGKKHSDKTKKIMSEKATGIKSSQFGTAWITNGIENKKIKKDIAVLEQGWYYGRKMKVIE